MTDCFGAGRRRYLDQTVLEAEHVERRIQQNAKGRLECDEPLLVQLAAGRL